MKIAQISSLLPETNYFRYLAQTVQSQSDGVEFHVYTDKNPQNLSTGVKNTHLVWDKKCQAFFQLVKKTFRDKPDLVHLHHEINLFGDRKAALLFPLLPPLIRLAGSRLVTTVHAVVKKDKIDLEFLEINKFPKYKFFVKPIKGFFTLIYKSCAHFSNKVIVHSQGLKDIYIKDYGGKEKKIVVIPHGVPKKVSVPTKAPFDNSWWSRVKDDPFALYFGYLHRRKGLEQVLEGYLDFVKSNPETPLRFVIAGGTLQEDYKEKLKKFVAKNKLDNRVFFAGFVSQDELRWLLNNCLLVTLPATYSISASGPLAQVIAHEKPALLTKLGVFAEELEDAKSALYVPPQSPDGWQEAIKIVMQDTGLKEKITQGIQQIHTDRSWPKIAREHIEIYKKVLNKDD